MSLRIFDPTSKRWRYVMPSTYSNKSKQWVAEPLPIVASELVRPTIGQWEGMPYIGEGTIWQRKVANMPLSPDSDKNAAWMQAHLNWNKGWGGTGFNTNLFGTPPIPVFVVDSSSPGCHFQYVDKVSRVDPTLAASFLVGKIPWPEGAKPQPLQDQSVAIWDVATGIFREYFYIVESTTNPGHWECASAGLSISEPNFANLGKTNYSTQLRSGSSAVVGMMNELGFLDIAGLLETKFDKNGLIQESGIKHALAFTCATMSNKGPSWPAYGFDGKSSDADAPFQGQVSRFKSSVDPHYNPKTKKPFSKMEQVIIVTAQEYGQIATDSNQFVHAYNAENGEPWRLMFGTDPWLRNGRDVDAEYDGVVVKMYGDSNRNINVNNIPWDQTEWAVKDWGRPDIDFGPMYMQSGPYIKGRNGK